MKRILYIHHGGGIGGAPLSLLYLLRQLNRSRYDPIVVTLKPGPIVDLYRAEGIETYVEPGISDFSHTTLEWYGGREWWRLPGKLLCILPSVQQTRSLIRKLKPDLVHLNSSTLTPCAIACQREGVPVVWHIREPLAHGVIGIRRAWIRRVLHRAAARVVAISQYDANQLIPSESIRVIYNFVDFSQFNRTLDGTQVRGELDIPLNVPVIAMLGGVAEPKGTIELVRALPLLLEKVPAVRIVVAGPPPRAGENHGLKGIAKQLLRADSYEQEVLKLLNSYSSGVQASLCFTGIQQNIPGLLAATDCLVFPSVVPHFARPIIEAAAMAKPSVASDLGGPRELIAHQETGLLVPARDPAALAEALSSILLDPAYARVLGEAAYQRARQLFDADKNATATVALYEELLTLS